MPVADEPTSELVDLDWVVRRLGTTDRHVYSLVAGREIPHLKVGGRLRFDPEAIEQWLRANTRVEAPEVTS